MFHIFCNLSEYLSFSPRSYVKLLLSNCCKKARCWQEVPEDIMEIILDSLPVLDRIRMSAVNKSWAVIAWKAIDAAPRLPWMMLPHEPGCSHLSFYDLLEGNVHKLKLPKELYGGFCFGSSKGWLIMVKQITIDGQTLREIQLFLFNPVSGVIFQLPSPTTIPSYRLFLKNHVHRGCNIASCFFFEIVLSGEDISNCTIAALAAENAGCLLTICRLGDKQWSNIILEKNNIEYFNILFYKGTLCAWVRNGIEQVTNITHKLAEDDQVMSLKLIPDLRDIQVQMAGEYESLYNGYELGIQKGIHLFPYLVESSNGELLLIIRIADVLLSDKYSKWKYTKTSGFEVFKMDANTGFLSRLYSLEDQVIFLSTSGNISLSARDMVGVEGNCIYFLENCHYFYGRYDPIVSRESGVYYLDNGRIELSFPSIKHPLQCHTSWFMPNSIRGR